MPVRQATPGPSTGIVLQQQQINARKRSLSEPDNEGYSTGGKKLKQDEENAVKDKAKKNRRRRKRKQSITAAQMTSRSAPATQQKADSSVLDTQSLSIPPNAHESECGMIKIVVNDAAPEAPRADKGKRKAEESHEDPQLQETLPDGSTSIESPQAKITRLTEELQTTTTLLQKHQTHLSQIHQSLTCQICLDLLHKPFALAPCGHVVCHGCLVRWFTASIDEGGVSARPHIYKRKTCPICRSVVTERPAEVWTVKGMVGGLVRSALIELPVPPPALIADDVPTQSIDGNPDPWRHIFRPVRRRNSMPFVLPPIEEPPGGGGLEDTGMYDAEDGGIYRCIECMNEISGGVCTFCERHYPGHQTEDDGDDVDLSDDDSLVNYRRDRRILRDLVGMFADGQQDLDDNEFDSWDGESLDGEEGEEHIMDNIPWDEEARFRQMGMAHAFDGLAAVFEPAPIMGGMHGMQLFPDHTEDEEEGGIAMIEEAGDDEEDDGYESSFIDDDSVVARVREVIELSDSEDGEGATRARRSSQAGQRWRADDSDRSEAEEDDSITVQQIARDIGGRSRARARVVDSDEDEGLGSSSPEVRVAGRRGNARRVAVDSDEPPVRSGRGRGMGMGRSY